LANAACIGITTRKTIVRPCIVNTWLYRSAERRSLPGTANCVRINRASKPPIRKNDRAATPYMIPIFLWSTVVNHDFQPEVSVGRVNTPRGRAGIDAEPEGSSSGVLS
jgi:hypothetical protein